MFAVFAAVAAGLCVLLGGCRAPAPASDVPASAVPVPSSASDCPGEPDAPAREMRGVWLSYLELDKMLNGADQAAAAAALDRVMDTAVSFGLNAVVMHVRANSDAYYRSSVFPAASAAAPLLAAGFDPLAYAVEAAHRRGLTLHAWVNPYRVGRGDAAAQCEDVFDYGGKRYYVPTSLAVQTLILDGVRELVDGYAIDGIQYDDYFYPDGCAEEDVPAPFEQAAYAAYQAEAGDTALSPGDWRRAQVDALVAATYAAAHSREGCVFGVSPSGDADKTYARYYADSRRWLSTAGYVDYLCPQIYFGFEHASKPFGQVAADWLSAARADGVALYVGVGVYKIGVSPDRYAGTGGTEWQDDADVAADAVRFLREQGADGVMLYSYTYLFPDSARTLQTWETDDGDTVSQTYDEQVAVQAMAELAATLRESRE